MLPARFLLLTAVLGLFALGGRAQPRTKQYVRQHLAPIASIQPDYANNSDLAAFGQAVGNARIVMLGEQDHGDGATFLAKTRLVKYLHEQKGFNVLAFEDDFFGLNQGWEQVAAMPDKQATFLHDNIDYYWSRCQQCDNLLYQYVPQTTRSAQPLRIAGFDNEFYSDYSRKFFPGYLHTYLTKNRLPFLQTRTYQQFFRPFLDTLLVSSNFITSKLDLDGPVKVQAIKNKKGKLKRFEACLDTLTAQLPPSTPSEAFDRQLLRNLYALAQESAAYTEDHKATYNVRDAQMAANLDWLANTKFKDQKIIVWAASFHVSKGKSSDYFVPGWLPAEQQAKLRTNNDAIHTMGQVFSEIGQNRQQAYILGFISGGGSSQRTVAATATPVPPPIKNSLESWLPANLAYAFLDFQPLQAQQAAAQKPEYFAMQGLRHQYLYADWTSFFDGVFYIQTMMPCTRTSFTSGK